MSSSTVLPTTTALATLPSCWGGSLSVPSPSSTAVSCHALPLPLYLPCLSAWDTVGGALLRPNFFRLNFGLDVAMVVPLVVFRPADLGSMSLLEVQALTMGGNVLTPTERAAV